MYQGRLVRFLTRARPGVTVLALWLIWGLIYPAAVAGMTWRELSGSLHSTFNNRHPWDYQNIVGLALTLIIFAFLMVCFKLYSSRQEKGVERFYRERRRSQQSVTLPNGHTQKRRWFRLKTRALLKWFHFRGFSPLDESDYKQDHMVDIGGGGLSFTTEKKLDIGAIITFLIDIGSGEPLSVWGRVVRVQEKTEDQPQRYFIAIQFAQLPDADRQRLVAWIMQGQRDAIHTAKLDSAATAAASRDQA